MMMLSIFFILIIPCATSLSFNFASFDPNGNEIICEGSTSLVDGIIQLTRNQQDKDMIDSVGRASYYQPMHLWDKTTRKLTDFTTHFSFVINSRNQDNYGDGVAFFLAPAPGGSKIPNATVGASMGLTPDDRPLNSTDNPFVAVEFDIFHNVGWDPPNREHVGVDINSVKSLATEPWSADIKGGKLNEAWISYNSSSLNLSIVFTGFNNDTTVLQHLSYILDLRLSLPELVNFGFSAATGYSYAIHSIHSWEFNSTLEAQENTTSTESPVAISPNSNVAPTPSQKKKANTGLAVGLGVGGLVLIGGLALISIGLWKKLKKGTEEEDNDFEEYMGEDFGRGTGPRKYSYAELARATYNFSDRLKLGEGGFGCVYEGFLDDTTSHVAIKRVSEDSRQGIREFASEVRIISQLRHRNLVQLIGWCKRKRKLLLVYELIPLGSLDLHLFGQQRSLEWAKRYRIAKGLASALQYLHEGWRQCVLHRDIKSSNIMLDSDYNAKLGDFGLARLVDHARGARTTDLAGTRGYIAPECVTTPRASKESDVYSFGVVALELACGRRPINEAPEDERNTVAWVRELYRINRLVEAADPRLGGDFEEDQMRCLMIVGLWCAQHDPAIRPSMGEVIPVLDLRVSLPNLPSNRPGPPPLSSIMASLSIDSSEQGQNQNLSSSFTPNPKSSDPWLTANSVNSTVPL